MKRSSISSFSDPHVIAELAAHLQRNNVAAIHIEAADGELKLVAPVDASRQTPHRATPVPAPASRPGSLLAKAPTAGIFVAAHPLAHPLRPEREIAAGSAVAKGDIVAFVKVGPVLVPVIAEKAGTVASVVPETGTLVGYGTSLFTAKT